MTSMDRQKYNCFFIGYYHFTKAKSIDWTC